MTPRTPPFPQNSLERQMELLDELVSKLEDLKAAIFARERTWQHAAAQARQRANRR